MTKDCEICKGEGWVCENHPRVAWGEGDGCRCGGAGAPCKCNTINPPWIDWKEIWNGNVGEDEK